MSEDYIEKPSTITVKISLIEVVTVDMMNVHDNGEKRRSKDNSKYLCEAIAMYNHIKTM